MAVFVTAPAILFSSSWLGQADDPSLSVSHGYDASYSDQSCVCKPHQGCCREHNSTRLPNPPPVSRHAAPSPKEQRSLSCRISRSLSDIFSPSKTIDAESESLLDGSETKEQPTYEVQTEHTIAPIHYALHYHLAFDYPECTLGQLDPDIEMAFIPELSCKDSATSDQGTMYYWSNELYFHKGTFLQKQEINCHLYKGYKNPKEHFNGCPHQSLSVSTPAFQNRNGLIEVQAWVTNQPPHCASHPRERWSSFEGRHVQMAVCRICHSDAKCVLELNGSSLHVRYTCYRDLGPAMYPRHPKWLSLLTGEGSFHRPKYGLELYTRVWNTARQLRRPGLYTVTHQTPQGGFDVASREY